MSCLRHHGITVGAASAKRTTFKEQATEFFEEANALNTDTAIFILKKQNHGLQRIAKEFRAKFPQGNKLILMKIKVFLKASHLVQSCKQHLLDAPLPP
jgi:hypothetical protein